MTRGSDKHGPRLDDDLAQDFEGVRRSNRPTRQDEWRDPEPPTDTRRTAPGSPTADEDVDVDVDVPTPGTDDAPTGRSLVDVVTEDHLVLERLFAEARAETEPWHFRELLDRAVAELVRHSITADRYLHPAIRQYLVDGPEIVEHDLAERARIEAAQRRIDQLSSDDLRLGDEFEQLVEETGRHIGEEEKHTLPRLREVCPVPRLRELGHDADRARDRLAGVRT